MKLTCGRDEGGEDCGKAHSSYGEDNEGLHHDEDDMMLR